MNAFLRLLVHTAFATAPVPAKLQAPDFTLQVKPSKRGELDVTALAPARHHINVDAPMFILAGESTTKGAPTSKTKTEAHFLLPASTKTFAVSLYLCDDANTFCEMHTLKSTWTPGQAKATTQPAATFSSKFSKVLKSGRDENDFILNDPKLALQFAREQNKLLLIDFYGIWCPPCNLLDADVFSTADFKRAAKDFIKLKLDADADISWSLKSKYKVSGYPTLIFAKPNGDEIGRIVGALPLPDFLARLQIIQKTRATGLRELELAAAKGSAEAAAQAGEIYFERHEYAKAKPLLALAPGSRLLYLRTEANLLTEEKKTNPTAGPALVSALNQIIKEFPSSIETLDARSQLAELLPANSPEQKAATQGIITQALALLAAPEKLKGQEMQAVDVLEVLADAQESAGQAAEAKASWKKAANAYLTKTPLDRGSMLEGTYCLWKSGDSHGAAMMYAQFESKYPHEFTFHYAHASMLLKEKNLESALAQAQKAYEYSYGDNRLRAALLLAKTHRALGQKDPAKKVIKKTLTGIKAPRDPALRTHRYIQQLKDLDAEIR
ncbi:MAG: thioredoxin family protein [Bdellovibrionales bacterium]|nr:thioredoxin family protein [Bdellovibrionales bacterium]